MIHFHGGFTHSFSSKGNRLHEVQEHGALTVQPETYLSRSGIISMTVYDQFLIGIGPEVGLIGHDTV